MSDYNYICPYCESEAVIVDVDHDFAICRYCLAKWDTIASLMEAIEIRHSELGENYE